MAGGSSLLQQIRDFLADYRPQRLSQNETTPAAVLLLLYEKAGEPFIVLTRRTEDVEHHKGETSFPGGAFDPQDGDLLTPPCGRRRRKSAFGRRTCRSWAAWTTSSPSPALG